MADDKRDEPIGTSTRVRDQPSLTTSSGKSWLILGGLLAVIAIAVLVPLLSQVPAGLALFGICAIVALYAAMIVMRLNMRPGRRDVRMARRPHDCDRGDRRRVCRPDRRRFGRRRAAVVFRAIRKPLVGALRVVVEA